MREYQTSRIKAALERAFDIVSGESVSYVPPGGDPVSLPTVQRDLTSEGLDIDIGGLKQQGLRELLFTKRDLEAEDVTFDPAGYFLIDDERWDFQEDEPILDHVVPLGGIHNLVLVRLRKAVELQRTQSGDGFTYGEWE